MQPSGVLSHRLSCRFNAGGHNETGRPSLLYNVLFLFDRHKNGETRARSCSGKGRDTLLGHNASKGHPYCREMVFRPGYNQQRGLQLLLVAILNLPQKLSIKCLPHSCHVSVEEDFILKLNLFLPWCITINNDTEDCPCSLVLRLFSVQGNRCSLDPLQH